MHFFFGLLEISVSDDAENAGADLETEMEVKNLVPLLGPRSVSLLDKVSMKVRSPELCFVGRVPGWSHREPDNEEVTDFCFELNSLGCVSL